MRTIQHLGAAAAISLLGVVGAQAADLHVRGVVTAVDGPKVTIKTREGTDAMLTLGDNWKIGGVTKASMADIKAGTFIGTANMMGPSGAKALEVVVFPEAMRGTGEGDYGWDLKPNSSMTNATVSSEVKGVDGQSVMLTYKGGEKKVTIPPDAPIVMVGGATAADIGAGEPCPHASPAHIATADPRQPNEHASTTAVTAAPSVAAAIHPMI